MSGEVLSNLTTPSEWGACYPLRVRTGQGGAMGLGQREGVRRLARRGECKSRGSFPASLTGHLRSTAMDLNGTSQCSCGLVSKQTPPGANEGDKDITALPVMLSPSAFGEASERQRNLKCMHLDYSDQHGISAEKEEAGGNQRGANCVHME